MIKALKRAHPLVIFAYFVGMFLLAPFSRHPWMTGVQMICLYLLYFYHNRSIKKFLPLIGLIVIVAVTNPLFVQRGRTVLYAGTHVRITKEALLYGIHYAGKGRTVQLRNSESMPLTCFARMRKNTDSVLRS